MSIKNKIIKDLIEPVSQTRNDQIIVAKVTISDEKNNICSIQFTDKDGQYVSANNVKVRLISDGIIDWFPKKDDLVQVLDTGGQYEIISKYSANYASSDKTSTELKKDIFSNLINDIAGNII